MPRLSLLKSPFFWKTSLANITLIAFITVGLAYSIYDQLETYLKEDIQYSLLEKATLVTPMAEQYLLGDRSNNDKLKLLGQKANTRITIIAPDGTVAFDSQNDHAVMDNHANRKEIVAASKDGASTTWRYSKTTQARMAYAAVKITHQDDVIGYVRMASLHSAFIEKLNTLQWSLVIGGLIAIFATILFGTLFAKSINLRLYEIQDVCNKMRHGHFTSRVTRLENDEIGLLGKTLNHLSQEFTQKMHDLSLEKTQMRTTLAGMVEGLISLDKDHTIRFCNQAAYTLLHCPIEDSRGLQITDVDGFARLKPLIDRVNIKRQFLEDEIKVRTSDFYKTLEVRINYYKKSDAEGYLILLHDVSHLRQLERVRRDFVANVSHELKTPLTAIRGYAETLLDGADKDPEVAERFLRKIETNAHQLQEIVTDLLSLAHLESNESEPSIHPIQWSNIVSKTISSYEHALSEKNIKLTNQVKTNQKVMGDDESLGLILDNLISNAIRYSPGGGEICIRSEKLNQKILLHVEDTGIGIPKQDIDKVFERFYRVDKARSKKLGGTGLGLSIVKHLVVRLGGDIKVYSELGVGSRFTVALPSI